MSEVSEPQDYEVVVGYTSGGRYLSPGDVLPKLLPVQAQGPLMQGRIKLVSTSKTKGGKK